MGAGASGRTAPLAIPTAVSTPECDPFAAGGWSGLGLASIPGPRATGLACLSVPSVRGVGFGPSVRGVGTKTGTEGGGGPSGALGCTLTVRSVLGAVTGMAVWAPVEGGGEG